MRILIILVLLGTLGSCIKQKTDIASADDKNITQVKTPRNGKQNFNAKLFIKSIRGKKNPFAGIVSKFKSKKNKDLIFWEILSNLKFEFDKKIPELVSGQGFIKELLLQGQLASVVKLEKRMKTNNDYVWKIVRRCNYPDTKHKTQALSVWALKYPNVRWLNKFHPNGKSLLIKELNNLKWGGEYRYEIAYTLFYDFPNDKEVYKALKKYENDRAVIDWQSYASEMDAPVTSLGEKIKELLKDYKRETANDAK